MTDLALSQPPLSDYESRKLSDRCVKPGCKRMRDASGESALCGRHWRAAKKSAAKSNAKRRDARRAAGLCIWCSGDKPHPATPGSPTCMRCRLKHNALRASDGVVKPDVSHDRRTRIASRTITGDDGRTRYHGQDRRGQQTHAQLDAQDLGFARREIGRGETGLEVYAAEVARSKAGDPEAMPRIQRDGLRSDAVGYLARAQRHLEDVVERHGGHAMKRHGRRDGDEE